LKRGRISKKGAKAVVAHKYFVNEFTLKQLRPDMTEAEWKIYNHNEHIAHLANKKY